MTGYIDFDYGQTPSIEHMEKLEATIADLAEENERLRATIARIEREYEFVYNDLADTVEDILCENITKAIDDADPDRQTPSAMSSIESSIC